MTTWFNTVERREKLLEVAVSWKGTPFFSNSESKGRGVSCQKLVSAIYRETGCLDIEVPEVPMCHARFSRGHSLVEEFMIKRPEFYRNGMDTVPGDLIGFRLFKIIHHLGICVGRGEFVHACEGAGVIFSQLSDSTWMTRMGAVWRPLCR